VRTRRWGLSALAALALAVPAAAVVASPAQAVGPALLPVTVTNITGRGDAVYLYTIGINLNTNRLGYVNQGGTFTPWPAGQIPPSPAPDVAIGEALLDQRNLAGVGNMYKCEVLFLERVSPWRPNGAVDLAKIVATAYRLMRANRDHPTQSTTGRTGRGQEHWVYGRSGAGCLRCRTPIKVADQGTPPHARSTYWCPTCQPA